MSTQTTQTQARTPRRATRERHHDVGAWVLALPDCALLAVGQQFYEGRRPKARLSLTGRSILLPRMEQSVRDRTPSTEVAWFDGIPWALLCTLS